MTGSTIVALASAAGRGSPAAIIRLSGDRARTAAAALFHPGDRLCRSRRRQALEGRLTLPGSAARFPATAYLFVAPHSYTGEDVVELHVPGAPAVVAVALQELLAAPGVRHAHPGEFTRRACAAGLLDLARAEALAALIQAEDAGAVRAAGRTLRGGVSEGVERVRSGILDLLAHLEAELDFAEDEIDLLPAEELRQHLSRLVALLELWRARTHQRPTGHGEPLVVLLGPPNAGKSSLFNALLEEEVAAVRPEPGTTRDASERTLGRGEHALRLADVAGVGEARTPVETRAQELVEEVLRGASHVLLVASLDPADRHAPGWHPPEVSQELVPGGTPCTLVHTKLDRAPGFEPPSGSLAVSALTGAGVAALREHLERLLASGALTPPGAELSAGAHTADRLDRAREALGQARRSLPLGRELVAEELRQAAAQLDALLGRQVREEVLERIFSRFCIGK